MNYERNKMLGLIYAIFQAEEWKWWKDDLVPTFDQIESKIDLLEADAIENMGNKKYGSAETGRLLVKYDKDGDIFEYYINVGSSR